MAHGGVRLGSSNRSGDRGSSSIIPLSTAAAVAVLSSLLLAVIGPHRTSPPAASAASASAFVSDWHSPRRPSQPRRDGAPVVPCGANRDDGARGSRPRSDGPPSSRTATATTATMIAIAPTSSSSSSSSFPVARRDVGTDGGGHPSRPRSRPRPRLLRPHRPTPGTTTMTLEAKKAGTEEIGGGGVVPGPGPDAKEEKTQEGGRTRGRGSGKNDGSDDSDDGDDGVDGDDYSPARTPREILDRIEAAVGGGGGGTGDHPEPIVVATRGGRLYQYVMKAGVERRGGSESKSKLGKEAGASSSPEGGGDGDDGNGKDGGGGGDSGNNGGGGKGLDPGNVDEVLDYLVRLLPGRPDVARGVLSEHPRILRRSVGGQLEPTVEFLQGLYGEGMLVEALSRNPSLLLVSGIGYRGGRRSPKGGGDDGDDGDVNAMESFLRCELGMTPGSVLSMKKTAPRLFQLSVERTVRPTLLFLSQILANKREVVTGGSGGTIGDVVSEDDNASSAPLPSSLANLSDDVRGRMRRIVRNNPALLSLDVERNLAPTVDFLRNVCHLDDDSGGLGTLVRSCPSVLGLSVEDNLRHTVQFLAEDVGLGAGVDGLGRCLRRHPQILALSLGNLREKVEFFRRIELGQLEQDGGPPLGAEGSSSSEEEDAAVSAFGADDAMPHRSNSSSSSPPPSSLSRRVAIGAPSTYSLSLRENIVPKVAALRNLWGEESLPRLLSEYPPILTLSLQGNIQPTINFFNRTGYVSLDEHGCIRCEEPGTKLRSGGGDCDAIIRPRYLAASLYNRLLPRWHYLHEVGICATETHAKGALPALHVLAGSNDANFCKKFSIDAVDYTQFREEAIPKLKFSSQFETWIKTGRPIDDLT